MIITEYFKTRKDGVVLIRTYSDKGTKIQKIGTDEIYDEAIDIEGAPFSYVETNEPIEIFE
jgi:hypothetical protein